MGKNLVIVESPAKAKTIEKFLGKDFSVKSSFGHIRDLAKKNLGIDVENNFEPDYIVPTDKKKIVAELKKLVKESSTVWLAADEDREGEAIAWHLYDALKLSNKETKRIVFHEITKTAITAAIKNPREINIDLVDAQQARRVLDRLVGFELSPVLWKKVKPSLSAGRVQSVAVRIIVEREREILHFKESFSYKVSAEFNTNDNKIFKAELLKNLSSEKEVSEFLNEIKEAEFKISDVIKKPAKKTPSAPFTTSTLQQEASRKMGFSVSKTMMVAQKLYESGKITYMRTDSVNLSSLAVNTAKKEIISNYGEKYSNPRKYSTKSKGAQEAHEAIRPTYLNKQKVEGSSDEQRLYDLIWKRTIASQMSDAQTEKTSIKIANNANSRIFSANGEVIKFDGFLKVYLESTDDEQEEKNTSLLPQVNANDIVINNYVEAVQKFARHPARYTEASLVRKLEELGIGRPSTYAPTISTVQKRGYVVKEARDGIKRKIISFLLSGATIKEELRSENTGYEKNKLFPTDIGMVVNDFLIENFKEILDFNFTAKVEQQFDEIADGKLQWKKMIKNFYDDFHKQVEVTTETAERNNGERVLGVDPASGKTILVRIGRFGPMAQIGKSEDEEKPTFAGLLKDQHIETITIEEALELFKLPRDLGLYEDKKVVAAIGRFGPYIRHDSKFVSLKKDIDDPYTVELDRAIELIEEKRKADREKIIQIFEEEEGLSVLNGRWGPYISYNKKNYKIPKTTDPSKLTYKDCKELIKNPINNKAKKTTKKKGK